MTMTLVFICGYVLGTIFGRPCVNLIGLKQYAINKEIKKVYNQGEGRNLIQAIKRHRELTHAGLKESKEYVEKLVNHDWRS